MEYPILYVTFAQHSASCCVVGSFNYFFKEVIKGTYNATAGGVLCECHIKNGIFHGIHVSRGRLIRLADSNFEKTYSKEYATKVLAIGELAPNEKK